MTQDGDIGAQEPPRTLVFLQPRGSRARRLVQPPSDYEDRAPYPRWFTIPARGTLTGLEIAAAVYIAWYQQGRESSGQSSGAEFALAGVGLAAAIDGLITILSIVGLYEAGASCTAAFIDVIPAVISCVGAIGVAWPERRVYDDPWMGPQNTSAAFAGAVA
ncbi:hypothetical protein C8A00DRAFT_35809 [Chaetomidium leptoderma]|uniref:Uncharacterized protein n=1 Tax=Chaetomidium leptoderma TaxID=669021 RepID=A0AAN6VHD2_9PEZI|nr:hypothetical protein C8A00DRAFT_35809 [Chaetomidium leptoderma]